MTYWVAIEVENPTNVMKPFTIPAGRIFMPKVLGKAQCLVATKGVTGHVGPGKQTVYVPTNCIDPPLPPPAHVPMSVTIFGQKQRTREPFRLSR
jgi:hypothetical protein